MPKGYEYIPFHAILSTDLFLIFRPFDSTRASTARENDCLRWRWINLRWFLYSYAPSTISKEEIEGLRTGYFQALFPETALLLIGGQGLRKRNCFRASTNSSTRSLSLHVPSEINASIYIWVYTQITLIKQFERRRKEGKQKRKTTAFNVVLSQSAKLL